LPRTASGDGGGVVDAGASVEGSIVPAVTPTPKAKTPEVQWPSAVDTTRHDTV
jgi:hypothetical protein